MSCEIRRVADLVHPSMCFGALIARDHVGEYVQRLGRNIDAEAFDTARGFSEAMGKSEESGPLPQALIIDCQSCAGVLLVAYSRRGRGMATVYSTLAHVLSGSYSRRALASSAVFEPRSF
jgi:hypothetical protein